MLNEKILFTKTFSLDETILAFSKVLYPLFPGNLLHIKTESTIITTAVRTCGIYNAYSSFDNLNKKNEEKARFRLEKITQLDLPRSSIWHSALLLAGKG